MPKTQPQPAPSTVHGPRSIAIQPSPSTTVHGPLPPSTQPPSTTVHGPLPFNLALRLVPNNSIPIIDEGKSIHFDST
ncbi:hypothetical protein CsatB_020312 [Cannabis sativa]